METYCCCECCGYIDIFRCEQAGTTAAEVAAKWNESRTLDNFSQWTAVPSQLRLSTGATASAFSTANAAGGSMDVTIGATAIKASGRLIASQGGTSRIEVGLFDNQTLAKFEVDLTNDQEQWINGYYRERLVLDGVSRHVIRHRVGAPYNAYYDTTYYEQCYVELVTADSRNDDYIVTAMVPSFGGYAATDYWVGIGLAGRLVPYGANGPLGLYTRLPPTSFSGCEARKLHVYRDGGLVGTIERADEEVSLDVVDADDGVNITGDGSISSPLSGTVTGGGEKNFFVVPSKGGILRVRGKLGNAQAITVPGQFILSRTGPYSGRASSFTGNPVDNSTVYANGDGDKYFDQCFAVHANQSVRITAGVYAQWLGGENENVQPSDSEIHIGPIALYPGGLESFPLTESQRNPFSEQGSYFVVAEYDGSSGYCRDNSTPRGADQNLQAVFKKSSPLYAFASFVVLTEKPAVAVFLVNDVYERGTGGTFRPTRFTAQWENPAPETITLEAYDYPSNTWIVPDPRDVAGNSAFLIDPPTATAHPLPADGRLGATARFEPPEPLAWRIYQRPLPYIDLFFDKPVSGVASSMISLVRQSPPSGAEDSYPVTLTPITETQYRIMLPIAAQNSNTQWKITFTPSASVIMWPKGVAAEPYEGVEEGTSRLVARFMWALGKDKSIGRYVMDTACEPMTYLGKIISETATVSIELPEDRKTKSRIASSGTIALPARGGQFRSALPAADEETFIPRLPSNPDSNDDGLLAVSYFGLKTTIYPSLPRTICECSAPSQPQPHGSLIFGGAQVGKITLKLKTAFSTMLPVVFNYGSYYGGGPVLIPYATFQFSNKLVGVAIDCITTKDDAQLPQNMWFCKKTTNLSTFVDMYSPGYWSSSKQDRATCKLKSLECTLQVARGAQTYGDMATTTMSQLCFILDLSGVATVEYSEGPSAGVQQGGDRKPAHTTRLLLTKEQEVGLAAGEDVDVEDTEGSVWTLKAEIKEED